MPQYPMSVEMKLSSALIFVEMAATVCSQFAQRLGFSDEECADVGLALTEAMNNAIIHGNRMVDGRCVYLRLMGQDGQIDVAVRDEGDGFDPMSVPDPTSPENLLKPCGRGIFLMRHLMDDVSFRCRNSGGTEVTMKRAVRVRTSSGRD